MLFFLIELSTKTNVQIKHKNLKINKSQIHSVLICQGEPAQLIHTQSWDSLQLRTLRPSSYPGVAATTHVPLVTGKSEIRT